MQHESVPEEIFDLLNHVLLDERSDIRSEGERL